MRKERQIMAKMKIVELLGTLEHTLGFYSF